MNATIAWTAGACLAVGWVAGFLAGTGEPGESDREKTERLFREGLLEVGIDLAELGEAPPSDDKRDDRSRTAGVAAPLSASVPRQS